MTCILIPPVGPPRPVFGSITVARISDLLDGAVPVTLTALRAGLAFNVRETCAAEGATRNRLASVTAALSSGALTPLPGPVVVTGIAHDRDTHCHYIADLPEGTVEALLDVTLEIQSVLERRSGTLSGWPGGEAWADRVRSIAALCDTASYPPDFPHQTDPVARVFRRAGIRVRAETSGWAGLTQ